MLSKSLFLKGAPQQLDLPKLRIDFKKSQLINECTAFFRTEYPWQT